MEPAKSAKRGRSRLSVPRDHQDYTKYFLDEVDLPIKLEYSEEMKAYEKSNRKRTRSEHSEVNIVAAKIPRSTEPLQDDSHQIATCGGDAHASFAELNGFVPSPGSDSNSTIPLDDDHQRLLTTFTNETQASRAELIDLASSDCETPGPPTILDGLLEDHSNDNSSSATQSANEAETVNEPLRGEVLESSKTTSFPSFGTWKDIAPPLDDAVAGDFAFIDFTPAVPTMSRIESASENQLPACLNTSPEDTKEIPEKNGKCEADSSALDKDKNEILRDNFDTFFREINKSKTVSVVPSAIILSTAADGLSLAAGSSNNVAGRKAEAVLPEVISGDCMPSSSISPSKPSDEIAVPLYPFDEDQGVYVPLNVSDEFLNNQERDLREAAGKIKAILAPISADHKILAHERELLKSQLAEQQADLSIRTKVIDSLKQTAAANMDNINKQMEERTRHLAMTSETNRKLVESELVLRKLQVAICKDKLKATIHAVPASDSLLSAIMENEAKVVTHTAEISRCYQLKQRAGQELQSVEERLKKIIEEDTALRRRIEELEVQHKAGEAQRIETEENLELSATRLKQLNSEYKHHSSDFVDLEMTMVKIKMCRKLKELRSKKRAISGTTEAANANRNCREITASASNVQYSSQMTVIGANYSSNSLCRAGATVQQSMHHIATKQSLSFHNIPWHPQPLLPVPAQLPAGFLQMGQIVRPWLGSQALPKQ